MNETAPRRQRLPRVVWIVWVLAFLVICGDVVRRPLKHTTTPTYRLASTQWWAGQDPYNTTRNHDAFLYGPQAAMAFTPFTWGPFLIGEFLWRAVTFGLFAYAMLRLYQFFLSRRDATPGKTFLLLSLLAVPSALASLRNAQFDLPLAALLLLSAAEVASGRWNRAAIWLCVALALKPLAVVPLLLFGALYGKLIPRIAVGFLIVLALPFLNTNPAFVVHEYARFAQSLTWASRANEPRYSDLGALLSEVSIHPSYLLMNGVRAISALLFLGWGWSAVRRLSRIDSAWTLGALSAIYLMLFNPRTETCSYVFLAPFVASLALRYAREKKRRALGIALGFAALGLACDAIPVVQGLTDRWLKPLLALAFLPVLAYFVFSNHGAASPREESAFGPDSGRLKPRGEDISLHQGEHCEGPSSITSLPSEAK